MKNLIKYILPLLFIFIGFNVNAKGLMIIQNGTPIEQCSNCWEMSPTSEAYITNYRVIEDPRNFSQNDTYYFTALIETQTLGTSVDVSDCGLNINGSYVTPNTRNSYRITNAQHGNLYTIRFQTEMTWQSPSSLTNVPVFIQCDTSPQAQTRYVAFSSTISADDTSTGISIANQTRDLIENNNSNTNTIGGKIDNNTNFIGGKLDSHANTISGKLQQIIDNLTNLGSNIISGISSTIQSVGNAITNKIGELIGLNEVCETYFKTDVDRVLYGSQSLSIGYLAYNGSLVNNSNYRTTDFIEVQSPTTLHLTGRLSSDNPNAYLCTYDNNKNLIGCHNYNVNSEDRIFNFTLDTQKPITYVRYGFAVSTSYFYTLLTGNCQKSGILGLFNNFNQFVRNFFNPTIDDANSLGSSEFNNFTTTNVGLRGLLDTLVTFVHNIFTQSCSALVLPIPFVDHDVTLPCMSSIYTTYFPTFFGLYQLITTGLIAYRVIINLFHKVHQLEDVNYDKVEVLDL